MTLSRELTIALSLALDEARERGHEFITLEHVLYALLTDPTSAECLQACGVDLKVLEKELDTFFTTLEKAEMGDEDPEQTDAFRRVLNRSALHVQSSGKTEIRGPNVLVALFSEDDSHAVHMLRQQGVEKLDVTSFIAHGRRKVVEDKTLEGAGGEPGKSAPVKDPLGQFCVNLNKKAIAGKIDPLIGRSAELERTIQVLARRRKNNPLYLGDAGVGKTAIVEGLALAIVEGRVPDLLKPCVIYALDMGAVVAGTRYRGDFEERVKAVVDTLVATPEAILFIDEIHTVIGAGATSGGSLDASNILKPALANGELRCIGSSTHQEYRQSFGKDRAFARRFQTIEIGEPTVEETILILEGLKTQYEKHHGITYTSEALDAAARLSARYINERFLPDKAIDVIDEGGAAKRLSQPGGIVDQTDVETVVARIARIPPKSVTAEESSNLKNLANELRERIFGQEKAIDAIASVIKLSRAGLGAPNRPVGCFLFSGPTGVGKTELAKQLAEVMGVQFLRFDMSEYSESHTVSRLIGAPPGYIGFDQEGLLTGAVSRTPHAVLVLDEIEKAHPQIFNILLQVMDNATLTDNNGKKADFRNVVLILTTNAGAREAAKGSVGFTPPGAEGKVSEALNNLFPPEFRNRLDGSVVFGALTRPVILQVVDKFVLQLGAQLQARDVTIEVTTSLREWLGNEGYKPAFGAREMGRVIQDHLKKALADELLFGRLQKGGRVLADFVEGAVTFDYTPRPEPEAAIAAEPEVAVAEGREPAE